MGRRILVVDDTADCLDALARLLRCKGHTVECAGHGGEALEVLGHFVPDVIILDMMMPVRDGIGFLEAMRADARWEGIRVIVNTGYADHQRTDRLAELGVSEVVLKGSADWKQLLTFSE